MCTLVSRDYLPFCKYIKRHVYPENQNTYDKLNQIRTLYLLFKGVETPGLRSLDLEDLCWGVVPLLGLRSLPRMLIRGRHGDLLGKRSLVIIFCGRTLLLLFIYCGFANLTFKK